MQDISWRSPSERKHWTVSKTGTVTYSNNPSSSQFVLRTQSGYKGKKPKTNPMEMHAYRLNCQRMSIAHSATYAYTDGSMEYALGPALSATINGATFLPTYDWNPLKNAAIAKLGDNVRGNLDVSVDLAEAHKTAHMLKLQRKVIDYTRVFTRKWGVIKSAANAWLEYTYGVKPLLQTLYGVADENLRTVINKTSRFSARVSSRYVPQTCTVWTIFGPVAFPVRDSNIKVSVSIGCDMRTDQFDLARWSSLNPVSIAWELLPYSFVVDWFLNVGGYLRDMETYLLYANKFRSGYMTTLVTGGCNLQLIDFGKGPGEIYHQSVWAGGVTVVDIQRSILSSYPAPTLPSFDARLGSSRLISGAALLGQLLGRR